MAQQRWETKSLRELASIDRQTVKPEEIRPDDLYVGLENIGSDGRFKGVHEVEAGVLKSNKFRFDSGHVLYGKLRPYLSKIARPNFPGICSTDVLPLRPGPALDGAYLFHFLRTPQMVDYAASRSTGINLPRLSPRALEDLEIPFPPIEEQRRIAAVLDAADELRAKRRQALAKLDSLTQAIFIDMFGSPHANAHGFEEVELGELVEVKGGKRLPKGSEYALTETDLPYIRVTDFRDGFVELSDLCFLTPEVQRAISRYTVAAGDVIISIAGSIGQIAAIPESLDGANLTENAAKLVRKDPSVLRTEYLASFLRSDFAQHQMASNTGQVTIGKLALFRIASLRVLLPPIDVQSQYETAVAQLRVSRDGYVRSATKLDSLFGSLQQRAFRGEL